MRVHGVDRDGEAEPLAAGDDRGVDADDCAGAASRAGRRSCPGLSAASVWITCSIRRPVRARSDRPSALTTPVVTVCWKP